jgi:zinc transporter ZupT
MSLSLSMLENHEFVVGLAVAVIMLSAFVASALFRNVALALAAGSIVLLYVQSGVPGLLALSKVLENEIKTIPDFSQGLMVGAAVSVVLLLGLRQRRTA